MVAFDDVTDLVAAQRMAAWGDVARRIAHEIKNPLTPIQLSAERHQAQVPRRWSATRPTSWTSMTDVIVRQTNDLRRIVDEFSKFARMPEPERREQDLGEAGRATRCCCRTAARPDVQLDSRPAGRRRCSPISTAR